MAARETATSWSVSYYYDKEGLARPNDDWYPPAIFFQGMKSMFFGDPTLPMPPSDMRKD